MKLSSPTINKAALDATDASSLCTEARIEQALLAGDATGIKAANVSIEESVIERVLFIEARLEKLSLGDVELKACDLSAARCSESSLIRVRFNGGRMTGVDFSRSTLKDVVFEDCKLDMVNFRFVKLTRVKFINCVLNEADFQAAELKEVMFEGCHLEKVEFGQCKIQQVDARTSQLYDIRGWQFLKGLTIDSTQLMAVAPELAIELGLIIKTD